MAEKKTGHHGPYRRYESVRERATRGAIQLVDPLDYLILEKLPEQGTTLGGLVPLGESVRNLQKQHFKPLTTDQIAGRLRAMEACGYVVSVAVAGGAETKGWQIMPAGQKVLQEWENRNGQEES